MITDAGGGHRGTADSLREAIARRKLPWDVRIVNAYREGLFVKAAQRAAGVSGENIYNFVLRHNLIIWAGMMRQAARLGAEANRGPAARQAREFFLREKPDLVVSLMPFINDMYAQALAGTGIPFGLLLTDLTDRPPYMWLSPGACKQAVFVAVGSPQAAAQAREQGANARLVECGLVIHPKHFEAAARKVSRAQARQRFGLEPGLFTVMILMGGLGSKVIAHFARQFESSKQRWQIIACCGKNEALRLELEKLAPRLRNKLVPVGFSRELHLWMRASDLLLTKPGPASLMEGAAMQVPLVLDHYQTMPQEIPNVDFVEDHGLGVVVRQRKRMAQVVQELADDPSRLATLRKNLRKFHLKDATIPLIEAMKRAL